MEQQRKSLKSIYLTVERTVNEFLVFVQNVN